VTLPSGWLMLDGIRFRCVIGVTDGERASAQDVLASLSVKVDFGKAAASDCIEDTVDYRALARRVIEAGERSRVHLVETLAAHLAQVILGEFPGVEEIRVEVEKPGVLSTARSVRAVVQSRR
jgi:dihydroneopterin aldolase